MEILEKRHKVALEEQKSLQSYRDLLEKRLRHAQRIIEMLESEKV